MQHISSNQKYKIHELARRLKFPSIVATVFREKFGETISINELKQISWHEFVSCKYLVIKRWHEFQKALAENEFQYRAVRLVHKKGPKSLIVEIDVSAPFEKVIQDLGSIINNTV